MPRTRLATLDLTEHFLGSEIFTAVIMKSSIFWDITACNPLKVNGHFGGTCQPHIQGRRINLTKIENEACSKQSITAWLILRPWRWRRHIPLKRRLTFIGLHGLISQKTELFLSLFCVGGIVLYEILFRSLTTVDKAVLYFSFLGAFLINLRSETY
jgi:hypothetical protein